MSSRELMRRLLESPAEIEMTWVGTRVSVAGDYQWAAPVVGEDRNGATYAGLCVDRGNERFVVWGPTSENAELVAQKTAGDWLARRTKEVQRRDVGARSHLH